MLRREPSEPARPPCVLTGTWAEFDMFIDFIDVNEAELAWHTLAIIATRQQQASTDFWTKMLSAARLMRLFEQEVVALKQLEKQRM